MKETPSLIRTAPFQTLVEDITFLAGIIVLFYLVARLFYLVARRFFLRLATHRERGGGSQSQRLEILTGCFVVCLATLLLLLLVARVSLVSKTHFLLTRFHCATISPPPNRIMKFAQALTGISLLTAANAVITMNMAIKQRLSDLRNNDGELNLGNR